MGQLWFRYFTTTLLHFTSFYYHFTSFYYTNILLYLILHHNYSTLLTLLPTLLTLLPTLLTSLPTVFTSTDYQFLLQFRKNPAYKWNSCSFSPKLTLKTWYQHSQPDISLISAWYQHSVSIAHLFLNISLSLRPISMRLSEIDRKFQGASNYTIFNDVYPNQASPPPCPLPTPPLPPVAKSIFFIKK